MNPESRSNNLLHFWPLKAVPEIVLKVIYRLNQAISAFSPNISRALPHIKSEPTVSGGFFLPFTDLLFNQFLQFLLLGNTV